MAPTLQQTGEHKDQTQESNLSYVTRECCAINYETPRKPMPCLGTIASSAGPPCARCLPQPNVTTHKTSLMLPA